MGRVVAGIGSGGIFSGVCAHSFPYTIISEPHAEDDTSQAILIIAASAALEKRPIYNGMLGSMYAFASVAGLL